MSGDLDTQVRTFVEQVLGAMGLSLAIDSRRPRTTSG